jgi:Family of unknown function (DUF6460)
MDNRNFGGDSVAATVLRLLIISLIVGVVLSALGINASNLFYSLNLLARRVYDLGFGAIDWILQYLLVGAIVVIPIWLVARILGAAKSRRT